MVVDSWDTLDATTHLLRSLRTTFGPRCIETSIASPTGVIHAAKLSPKPNLMASICHFQFHINHGKILAWTLCSVCLELEMARIPFLLLWTDSPKWLISLLATRSTMLHMLQICFVGKSCAFMESAYQSPSTPTTEQDIRLPASPPSRSSMASTHCPHWTFYLYRFKSAQTWTRVHESTSSRRCMKIQGTPLSTKYNDSRPGSTSTSNP